MGNNRFTASQVALALLPVVAVALVSFLMAYSFAHYIAPVFEIPEAQAAAPSYDAAELEQAVEVDEETRQAVEEAGEPDPQSAASADYATSAPANGYADGTYMGNAYGFRSTSFRGCGATTHGETPGGGSAAFAGLDRNPQSVPRGPRWWRKSGVVTGLPVSHSRAALMQPRITAVA